MDILRFVLVLVLLRWVVQLLLETLNRRYVRAHAGEVPEPFRQLIDVERYAKSVRYTLAKSYFHGVEAAWSAFLILVLLMSGCLPWIYQLLSGWWGQTLWAQAAYLFVVAGALEILSWPLSWYAQFHLEERFGFNTATPRTWWLDRGKGLLLTLLLGYPILAAVLFVAERAGAWWWLWAWGAVAVFQLILMWVAPALILPLFNRFSPLPEGSLRRRLFDLARAVGFPTREIQVMDGSRRSRHANAFFTGFGRLRKIVLFDTLIEQLNEEELAAVLAHEIGHFKRKHVPKLLAVSTISQLAGFYLVAVAARNPSFLQAFGFAPGPLAPVLLLFGLLSGTLLFWFSPLANYWSRRFEYAADAYAAAVLPGGAALIEALRKLNAKNLSNLTPHPLYSGFYYSHPTLLEREAALNKG